MGTNLPSADSSLLFSYLSKCFTISGYDLDEFSFMNIIPPLESGSLAEVMDSRQLDFDKPEVGTGPKRGQIGAKRYKNRR